MKTNNLFRALIIPFILSIPFDVSAEESLDVDKISQELSDPSTSLSSLTFRLQYRMFEGDLPGASDQDSKTLMFQPVIPFKRDDGSIIIFRPAIPMIYNQPMSVGMNDWHEETGLSDISFALSYSPAPPKENPGRRFSLGILSSLPTGDDDLGMGESTTLGPSVFYGELNKERVWGFNPQHQWDVGGDVDVSLTTMQILYLEFVSGGWVYGTTPIMTYNYEANADNALTLPLNLTVSKTSVFGGRPWRIGFELNYYVESPDDFGPKWMFGVNITPVVKNVLADWFK